MGENCNWQNGRHLHDFLKSIVIGKFCKRQQLKPLVLFMIAKNAKVGFKGLISFLPFDHLFDDERRAIFSL